VPNKPILLGATEPDFDHCFIVDPTSDPNAVPIDTRSLPLNSLFRASHPDSKVHFEALSTEPAFQFYSGGGIDVPAVAGLPARGKRAAMCVEPSRFVNAINIPEWRNQMLLKKGEKYGSLNVYRAYKA
jgi:aldose 1-epimerase